MAEKTTPEKAKALFNYLRELSLLRQKTIKNISDYSWTLYVADILGDSENIQIFSRDRTTEENEDRDPTLIRIHKPEFQRCPQPGKSIIDWLNPGWDDFQQQVVVKTEQVTNAQNGIVEKFDSVPERVDSFKKWVEDRDVWVEAQKSIRRTREIFDSLYATYVDLNREIETMEVVVANGFLLDKEDEEIRHPILTRRVTIRFESLSNTLSIEDLDVDTELYSTIIQAVGDVDLTVISKQNEILHQNDYHPLDKNDTPDYLKGFVHALTSQSVFSSSGVPTDWMNHSRILLYCDPVFIFRKRLDGTPRFLQSVVDNIDKTSWVPTPIGETVAGGKIEVAERDHEQSIEEQLAAVGGEDIDILLSKEANREQLEIAQRIELYNAVLVQGPPGTGKTHTIANLLGHFLAKGESVLVTSQTPKALQVLKEKLPKSIQPLCVSVLNDSNEDMERSVDGITSYMASKTANELKKSAELLKLDRENVITELAKVRKKIYSVINSECKSIVYNGEEISPSKAAAFISDNIEELSYIPGRVVAYEALPLSYNELIDLYRSNSSIDISDEAELECEMPDVTLFSKPSAFEEDVSLYHQLSEKLNSLSAQTGWTIQFDSENGTGINMGFGEFKVSTASEESLADLSNYILSLGMEKDWMKYAAVDGQKGGAYAKRWETLVSQIKKTCEKSEEVVGEEFGKTVEIVRPDTFYSFVQTFEKLSSIFERKGKVSKLDLLTDKKLSPAIESVLINGSPVQSKEDCDLVLHKIELQAMRTQCAAFWKDLIEKNGEVPFMSLALDEPERVAASWIPTIQQSLSWYSSVFEVLEKKLKALGIRTSDVFVVSPQDSALQMTDKIISAAHLTIPKIVEAISICQNTLKLQSSFDKMKAELRKGKRVGSTVCSQMVDAINSLDYNCYAENYKKIEALNDKYFLQRSRRELLERLSPIAPDWADAIRQRTGVHGESTLPSTILDAWKWKQYSAIIADIVSTPYDELQTQSLSLSKTYRKLTGEYAETLAWYHLLKRTEDDIDMRQALNGWKLTVRKIGKGTGKSAPKYKAQAKRLMAKCQGAVPAWIMPMGRVMESLDPQANQFDVVIVDEASQSDVSALGIMYLAKKVIIVGDDKQVSPMGIGTDQSKIESIEKMYIHGIVPNSHLYGAATSLYDIAATTYQPLMLREHFRCVPEIIGFSNGLSYDYKIKPLRDTGSSALLPAVVNYRVDDGQRSGRKQNQKEAQAIVALLKACIEQPEYKNSTFGVISMLGDEQAALVNKLVYKYIGPQEIEKRKILCGNPSHFQGDERDVIFLSLVDSSDGSGPLPKQEFGAGEMYRKRYNVAASRAKDQLWVVDSLDSSMDLKPGDIRKRLIDYSLNPNAFAALQDEIEAKADSPFEVAVASALSAKGYHLVQQWPVGAYRLDIVAMYGTKTVAIECDGERFHSGEAKIREDMERQTILERAGWRFIRIRGSEFYSKPAETINRVALELSELGIEPELQFDTNVNRETDLLQRVKTRAAAIEASFDEKETPSQSVIRAAYSPEFSSLKRRGRPPRNAASNPTPQISIFNNATHENSATPPVDKGTIVHHRFYGRGEVTNISSYSIKIKFNGGEQSFAFPGIFNNGTCKIVDDSVE